MVGKDKLVYGPPAPPAGGEFKLPLFVYRDTVFCSKFLVRGS